MKKTLSIALALLLLLASAAFVLRVRADGEATPISTADELCALAARVNSGDGCADERFLLTVDIDLGGVPFEPIGSGAAGNVFRGVFSGGGHRISGLFVQPAPGASGSGLFGRTEGGGISALSVSGSVLGGQGNVCTGGIVGTASGTALEGLFFEGVVTGGTSTGGVVGGAGDAQISGCGANAEVTGVQYTGGIAGLAGNVSFTGVTSGGVVRGTDRSGGVVGFCFDCAFENCVGLARLDCGDRAGGIAGIAQTSAFFACANLAPICAERFTGGVAGFCCGCELTECRNQGPVTGTDYVGGLIGWSDDGADFGENGLTNTVRRCMNNGPVRGEWGAGGLIGDAHNADIADCFNASPVLSDDFAGGLIGYAASSAVSRCINAGRVASPGNAGAITARNLMDSAVFEDCVYLDTSSSSPDPCGTAATDAGLCLETGYPSFDFDSVWIIGGASYPYARLRNLPAPQSGGDVDQNGEVTVSDAVTALRFAMGLAVPSAFERYLADIDANGSPAVSDALTILRRAMGIA